MRIEQFRSGTFRKFKNLRFVTLKFIAEFQYEYRKPRISESCFFAVFAFLFFKFIERCDLRIDLPYAKAG